MNTWPGPKPPESPGHRARLAGRRVWRPRQDLPQTGLQPHPTHHPNHATRPGQTHCRSDNRLYLLRLRHRHHRRAHGTAAPNRRQCRRAPRANQSSICIGFGISRPEHVRMLSPSRMASSLFRHRPPCRRSRHAGSRHRCSPRSGITSEASSPQWSESAKESDIRIGALKIHMRHPSPPFSHWHPSFLEPGILLSLPGQGRRIREAADIRQPEATTGAWRCEGVLFYGLKTFPERSFHQILAPSGRRPNPVRRLSAPL